MAANFFKSEDRKKQLSVPQKDETWRIPKDEEAISLFKCNHEEADTRLILHACLQDTNVVVVAKDTDIFVLMVYAYCVQKPAHKWYIKIDHNKYVDIDKVVDYLGEEIATKLPAIHALTVCDTTSSFFGTGKVRLIKKLKKQSSSLTLLEGFGHNRRLSNDEDNEDDEVYSNVKKFVQTMIYNGKEDETLVETRVRLYKALKTKSSESIPPDPDSLCQAIYRIYYQLYYWLNFNEQIVDYIPFEEYGWTYNAQTKRVVPVWFTGII